MEAMSPNDAIQDKKITPILASTLEIQGKFFYFSFYFFENKNWQSNVVGYTRNLQHFATIQSRLSSFPKREWILEKAK
jgi:hypothetical protein